MDAWDVLTLADAEAEIGGQDDALLAGYITSVSRLLDAACGPIVEREVTDQLDGGGETVALTQWPVVAVTSVVEYQGTSAVPLTEETAATGPSAGFVVDAATGLLRRRIGKSDGRFFAGRRNVVVDYRAGRYATTYEVDERFRRAAIITLRHLWTAEQGMGTVTFGPDGRPLVGATFALPNAAAAFVRDDLRISGLAGASA